MKLLTKPSLFILFLFCLFNGTAIAQKLELSANVNAGLFNYTGSAAANPNPYYALGSDTYTPIAAYSSKTTISYGANLQGQYVFKSGFMTGLQLGYDLLRSKTDLNGSYPIIDPGFYINNSIQASGFFVSTGNAVTTNQFINLSPYIGYRVINKQNASLDLIGGADIGFGIKSKQDIIATEPYTFHAKGTTTNPPTDYRLKAGFVIHVDKLNFNFSYAHGVSNYIKYDNAPSKVYSQLIRLGVGYQIY